jgi:hypothetical protein
VETKWERDRVREGALAWRGIGVVAARPWCTRAARCHATVESGGVGATRVDVADRWARAGARSSVSGCGAGQHGEAVEAAVTGGVGRTVRPIRFSNRIKLNQIYFKRIQICPKF